MSLAWNGWYHVTIHTYGSWLLGDARGWRERRHRSHVNGDYKHPPGDASRALLESSRRLMKRARVHIDRNFRLQIATEFADRLERDGNKVLAVSVDEAHVHLLAKFRDHRPRHWVGRAKKHISHLLRQSELREEKGGVWAKRSHATPLASRHHQVRVFHYILDHGNRGAAIWRFDVARQ